MDSLFCRRGHDDVPYELDRLFEEMPLRLAHMRDASSFALDLGACLGLSAVNQRLLTRSALLHDIGYAPDVNRFSFHPLDGAIYLTERQEHPWVVEGVLRHSLADRRASTLPGVADEYQRRACIAEAQWLVRMVTIADWRSAGVGGRVSFGQRLQDIVRRNPGNPDKKRRATAMVAEVRTWFLEYMQNRDYGQPLPWVFCDIDNTLIRPGDGLSMRNKSAIRAYAGKGGRFSLATGKHPRSIAPLAAELGLSDCQIAANGSCLLQDGRIQVVAHLGDAAGELRSRLEALGLPIAVYRVDGIEAGGSWQGWMDDVFDRYGEIRPVSERLSGPVLKILCVSDGGDLEQDALLRVLADSLGVDACRSDRNFLEFLPRLGNKGRAARLVMEEVGWPVLHSLAVGDTENDAAMFACCGTCAAVGNATEEACLGADWTIGECTADGVGRLLDLIRDGGGWTALSTDPGLERQA